MIGSSHDSRLVESMFQREPETTGTNIWKCLMEFHVPAPDPSQFDLGSWRRSDPRALRKQNKAVGDNL